MQPWLHVGRVGTRGLSIPRSWPWFRSTIACAWIWVRRTSLLPRSQQGRWPRSDLPWMAKRTCCGVAPRGLGPSSSSLVPFRMRLHGSSSWTFLPSLRLPSVPRATSHVARLRPSSKTPPPFATCVRLDAFPLSSLSLFPLSHSHPVSAPSVHPTLSAQPAHESPSHPGRDGVWAPDSPSIYPPPLPNGALSVDLSPFELVVKLNASLSMWIPASLLLRPWTGSCLHSIFLLLDRWQGTIGRNGWGSFAWERFGDGLERGRFRPPIRGVRSHHA